VNKYGKQIFKEEKKEKQDDEAKKKEGELYMYLSAAQRSRRA
jgi:hypothetical protein